jgi:hypothetical protein
MRGLDILSSKPPVCVGAPWCPELRSLDAHFESRSGVHGVRLLGETRVGSLYR